MKELIAIATLIAGVYGGTAVADWIYREVRLAALKKAAQGLPPLSPFARALTGQSHKKHQQKSTRLGGGEAPKGN